MFQIAYKIQMEELQEQYRHVHHAKALCLLEMARLRFLEEIGHPNESLIESQLFLVVTRVDVQYKRELFAEEVIISCENPIIDGRNLSLDQVIYKENGKPAVLARVYFMCMDGATKRGIRPPEAFEKAFFSIV